MLNRNTRIMFVDDDINILPMYELVGDRAGLSISVNRGGFSALRFLRDLEYEMDAVVIDLSMPDMDGITLTQQIRNNELLRSREKPIDIFWFTGWPFNPADTADPITRAANEHGIKKIYLKGRDDVQQIVEEITG